MPSASLQVPGRARIVPGQPPYVPEVAEGEGLAGPVAELPGGLDRGGVAGDGLVPRAVGSQQARQARGQRDDPGVLAGRGGLVQAGQQAGPLGPGPRQRLLPAGQDRDRGRRGPGRRGGGAAGLAGEQVLARAAACW